MEIVTAKPLKSSSNISEIVSKFAKVCKLRSIGVFPYENPLQSQNPGDNPIEESSNVTETDCEKIQPHPDELPRKSNACTGDDEIAELFDIVSTLKSAYVKLQKAHIPHNPDMIVNADKLVMDELEKLYKFRRAYKEKHHFPKPKTKSSRLALLQAKVDVNEAVLEALKSRLKAKYSEATRLVNELEELHARNVKLGENIERLSLKRELANDHLKNIQAFHNAFESASKSIHDFAKPLISLMKATGWDLDRAAKSIEGKAIFSKRSHKKYAFEAYIARRMFGGLSMSPETTEDVEYVMRFDDPIDALIGNPRSNFAQFCGKKYLVVVHRAMEMSFFGNLDHRKFVLSGNHPRTPFYQIFARMAKWIWVLHRIADSFHPKPKAFAVNGRSQFSDLFMETVEDVEKECSVFEVEIKQVRIVEFMIMPGFKIGERVVKSRVYVSN